MIANASSQNMGGLTALGIALKADIADFLSLNGSCKITYASGKSALSVYFTRGTALVSTPPADGNMYGIEIKFRSPKDRPALLEAITPYINKEVIVVATDANGEVKVYGSPDCPLKLTYAPTPKGVPADYNGIEFSANGLDFAPGRFLVTT